MPRSNESKWVLLGTVVGGFAGIAGGYALRAIIGLAGLWVALLFPLGCAIGLLLGMSKSLRGFNSRELCRECGQPKRRGAMCTSGRCAPDV